MKALLLPAKRELIAAEKAISAMEKATDYETVELEWENFLTRLERCWEKTVLEIKGDPKFPGINSIYDNHRKKDEMLSYLKQARNANEHSLQVVMEKKGNRLAVLGGGADGKGAAVEVKYIGNKNYLITPLNEKAKKYLKFYPKCHVLKVINRSVEFPEPKTHLGKNIENDFLKIAKLGLKFYQDAIKDIEKKLQA